MLSLALSTEVRTALSNKHPVLALESTILAHGMPWPENLEFAKRAETTARESGAVPATIAVLDGKAHVGLSSEQLERLCKGEQIQKAGLRDLPVVLSRGQSAATTVSATLHLANLAGVDVFATGGIGGVHRGLSETLDISQDLWALARTPGIVVSAGAKAILDLGKTLELLETLAVPVLGYQTDEFPAFYSRASGLKVANRVDTPADIAAIYSNQNALNHRQAMLIANPVPVENEIPESEIRPVIEAAVSLAKNRKISGKELTPFLLGEIVRVTKGRSLKTNIALALNNIKLGTKIAVAIKDQKWSPTGKSRGTL